MQELPQLTRLRLVMGDFLGTIGSLLPLPGVAGYVRLRSTVNGWRTAGGGQADG